MVLGYILQVRYAGFTIHKPIAPRQLGYAIQKLGDDLIAVFTVKPLDK